MRVEINGQDLKMDCKEVIKPKGNQEEVRGEATQSEVRPWVMRLGGQGRGAGPEKRVGG